MTSVGGLLQTVTDIESGHRYSNRVGLAFAVAVLKKTERRPNAHGTFYFLQSKLITLCADVLSFMANIGVHSRSDRNLKLKNHIFESIQEDLLSGARIRLRFIFTGSVMRLG